MQRSREPRNACASAERELKARQRAAEVEQRRLGELEATHRAEEEEVRARLTAMEEAHRAEEETLRGELNELERGHHEEEQAGRAELDSTRPHDLEAVWIRLEDGLVRHDWDAADAASIEILQRYAGGQVSSHARAGKIPDEVLTTLDDRWQELAGSRLHDRRWVWSAADGVTTVPITSRFSSKSSAETALARRLRDSGR